MDIKNYTQHSSLDLYLVTVPHLYTFDCSILPLQYEYCLVEGHSCKEMIKNGLYIKCETKCQINVRRYLPGIRYNG